MFRSTKYVCWILFYVIIEAASEAASEAEFSIEKYLLK